MLTLGKDIHTVGDLKNALKDVPDSAFLNIGNRNYGFDVNEIHYDGLSVALETNEEGVFEPVTDGKIAAAKQCLIDNGIDPDKAETVLQSLGYILLDTDLYPEEDKSFEEATFVSVWDGGFAVETACKVNLQTKEVYDIEVSEETADFVNELDEEFIRFSDGTKCSVERGKSDDGFWYDDDEVIEIEEADKKPSIDAQIQSAAVRSADKLPSEDRSNIPKNDVHR